MNPVDYESAKAALKELKEWELNHTAPDRNEASTRFHIVDRLIEDVLGWSKDETDVEHHHEGKFSDYELGSPAKLLLVEAKREGQQFALPVGWSKATAPISVLSADNSDLREALKQASEYCQNRGIPYGAVSNGTQLVAFVASRQDGIPPLTGRALVFSSLSDMLSRFSELWNSLSRPAVEDRRLASLLNASSLPPPPRKLSASITGYPGNKNRNPQAAELRTLGELFLEDLTRQPEIEAEFLAETYCQSGALSQYALVSKEILQARYATVFESDIGANATDVSTKKGIEPQLTKDMLAAGLSKRPILLVGDVGAGKTMFVRHLIKVQARDELARAVVLYLDLGTKPTLDAELRPYLAMELERQLLDQYEIDIRERNFVRGVYHGELRRFARGIYADLKESDPAAFRDKELAKLEALTNDPEVHLVKCLEHIAKGHKRQLVLFLDNVDQRKPPFQEQAFLLAQSVAEHWPVVVFLSLRPETFKSSQAEGSLSAYQPGVFTIKPPRVDQAVAKRLTFARELLEKEERFNWFPKGVTFRSENLLNYIRMLADAFTTNSAIIEFVENMSAGNVRTAMNYIGQFIGSAHVDSQKILSIIEKQGSYRLPLHEFMRAVICGDNVHYCPDTSRVPNLLDISADDAREHFLLPLLVAFVASKGHAGTQEGYVRRTDAFSFSQRLGFSPDQVDAAITRALEAKLIATPASVVEKNMLRVTTTGAYATERLLGSFTYLDTVLVDTPITDEVHRGRVHDTMPIAQRLERIHDFLSYLSESWNKLAAPTVTLDWPQLQARVLSEVSEIQQRVERKRQAFEK